MHSGIFLWIIPEYQVVDRPVMLKKYIKKFMPDHDKVRSHKHLQVFGTLLHDPNLFHMNRRSISGAFAVGLFCAWLPLPFQMIVAAAAAIYIRVNMPLAVALVWTSNPVTMPPLFFFAYKLGAWVLGLPHGKFHFELSFKWLTNELLNIWQPFLLGCFIMGVISSAAGYFVIRGLWRLHIISHLKRRKEQRRLREENARKERL
jgi:hypothetical protein